MKMGEKKQQNKTDLYRFGWLIQSGELLKSAQAFVEREHVTPPLRDIKRPAGLDVKLSCLRSSAACECSRQFFVCLLTKPWHSGTDTTPLSLG